MLGPSGRGYLAALILWPLVITQLGNLGIPSALTYSIARDPSASRGLARLGLSLGLVGSGAGMVGGLLFVIYINDIARLIELVTGQQVFDPTIYYFERIPTDVEPLAVAGVVLGAVLIAVLASVLPALRAARLHPVEALRYE